MRLWIKAFMEVLPQIMIDFNDTELVDLLLFSLPWLCHGKPHEPSKSDVSLNGSPEKCAPLANNEKCLELS